ncbi:MAG: glycosyltransferase family 4 protein [Actinomycetota bacterium]|nr:glycosyltransferase family 4 protein [Actinomycetota bacterium]
MTTPDRVTVAFDSTPRLDRRTGVGRYTTELARCIALLGADVRPYAVALRGRWDDLPSGARPGVRLRLPARFVHYLWRHTGAPSLERLTGPVDVVHGTNFVLPPSSAAGVVTVHDLSFYRDDTFPGGRRLRDLVPWSVERAKKVVVPSAAVQQEVVERFEVEEERVAVTHEGVSPVFFGATPLATTALGGLGVRPPFALAVSTLEPRKNLVRLLQAWEAAADDLEGWNLVLAGPQGWGPALPKTPGVVLTGWLGDATLPGLLSAAEFFCYPSLYEGFGLPPLEAMAAGTPVLAGSYPCAPEILGDSALLVDPTSVDAMASGIALMATDDRLRKRLAQAGRLRAATYTWEATATATLRAYREAMAT